MSLVMDSPADLTDTEVEVHYLQNRAVMARVEAVGDIFRLWELMVNQPGSVPELLRALLQVQMQFHGLHRAIVNDACAVGYPDREISGLLRITVAGFRSRHPHRTA